MQSVTIYGGTKLLRLKRFKELLGDIGDIRVENKFSIGLSDSEKVVSIEKIRDAIKFLNIKPKDLETKVVLIEDGEKMTPEAQNALLKTLEEPPSYALIVILAKSKRFLLETIISRCVLLYSGNIDVESVDDETFQDEVKRLLDGGIGYRIDWVSKNKGKFKDKEFAGKLMIALEVAIRSRLLSLGDKDLILDLDNLFLLKDRVLNRNCSVSLGVESFLINGFF